MRRAPLPMEAEESPASATETQILAEERHDMVLEPVGYGAGVSALIDLERISNTITIENVMQLAGTGPQVVLIADVHSNPAILTQIADILIHECQGRVRSPFGDYVRLNDAVLGRQIEIERRVLGIG